MTTEWFLFARDHAAISVRVFLNGTPGLLPPCLISHSKAMLLLNQVKFDCGAASHHATRAFELIERRELPIDRVVNTLKRHLVVAKLPSHRIPLGHPHGSSSPSLPGATNGRVGLPRRSKPEYCPITTPAFRGQHRVEHITGPMCRLLNP